MVTECASAMDNRTAAVVHMFVLQVTGGYAPAPAVPAAPAPAVLEQLHRVDLSVEPGRDKHW
jgi:hypothetical protein